MFQRIKDMDSRISVKTATFLPKHHFFGYYDKPPWNNTGEKMLALETNFIDRQPTEKDTAYIGLVESSTKKFKFIGKTNAWNWQQGCMLQWMPPNYDSKIIYNDLSNGKHISIIKNINSGKKRKLPYPIYAVHPNGKTALTLNFSRLHHTRPGYGYPGLSDPSVNQPAPSDDGIYIIDLETGERKLIISIKKVHGINHTKSMDKALHWINHITFNKDGTRFCFFHRWGLASVNFYTRLYTCNPDGTDLYCLLDSGHFTHFDWCGNNKIMGWGSLPGNITRIKRSGIISNLFYKIGLPIYRSIFLRSSLLKRSMINESYLMLEDHSKKADILKIYYRDGHCSFSPDGKWILSDTYSDRNSFRHLLLYNMKKKRTIVLGKFYSMPSEKYTKNKEWDRSPCRCDLHPRWSRDGRKICIDSVHEGSRQIYVIDVSRIVDAEHH